MAIESSNSTWTARLIEGALRQRLIVVLLTLAVIVWGVFVSPIDVGWEGEGDPVPVDAIPDLGENQQIVFTEWPGRSPQDIEDQITYPLTTALLGVPGVETIRSSSMFGFSSIYVIFEEDAEYYWTRARLVERLASLPGGLLPEGVAPQLGPDATALGQVFWYTLEGRTPEGEPAGGWSLEELRTLQDFTVRYALSSAPGVAEVASIGGHVREYQVEVDPARLRAYDVTLAQVANAVRQSNSEVGARTTEINGVEYLIRGVGYVENLEDIEAAPVVTRDSVTVTVGEVARVTSGPGIRRGALTRGGVEAVGGVVTARYGANPKQVVDQVKASIDEVQRALPRRTLEDGTVSQVTIVPFYDRSELIERTLGTLSLALYQQILITVLVVMLMMLHLRAGLLVSSLLPLAVLMTFVAMKYTGVDANVVALAGIAIAIGTMVDMGIVMTENIAQHLDDAPEGEDRLRVIGRGASEVAPAILTAITTTVVSFLPVFMLTGQEGKLFTPLAFTKTYALVASLIIALFVIPTAASWVLGVRARSLRSRFILGLAAAVGALAVAIWAHVGVGLALLLSALAWLVDDMLDAKKVWRDTREHRWARRALRWAGLVAVVVVVSWLLATSWMPLGAGKGMAPNLIVVLAVVGWVLGSFMLFRVAYPTMLRWILAHKGLFLALPAMVVVLGLTIWLGFAATFGWLPDGAQRSAPGQWMHHAFPGLEREFMPDLDEGTFLYMPSTMPHGSLGEARDMLQSLDLLFETVPEVEYSVGKLGRAESALDPAPVAMVETIIEYKPEYRLDAQGRRLRFKVDGQGEFVRDEQGELIEDPDGRPFRQWRDEIRRPEDIWDELVDVARHVPGLTTAPLLQPISTRLVMLQSGIRAPMAVRLQGDELEDLADAALKIQEILREHPLVNQGAVNADRPVGKPYLVIEPERRELTRYGVSMEAFQQVVEAAIGGASVGQTVEGRERFAMRVRYPRELRDDPQTISRILVATPSGAQVPLGQLASIRYERGPEMIRSENSALVAYVMFDAAEGTSEVSVVESVRARLDDLQASGELELAEGVRLSFAGSYENSLRAEARLRILVPLILLIIALLIYLQFRSLWTALTIFSGIAVAFGGGFMLIWLYGQSWFLDVSIFGASLREIFQIEPMNLSVAVWVGFIALFGIAADDGVVMATYLKQRFDEGKSGTVDEVRERVVEAGLRRIRPCLMTTATTVLALLPVLTSYGTGADVMIPMAVPAVGGMTIALLTLFVVPTLYCAVEEGRLRLQDLNAAPEDGDVVPASMSVEDELTD
ncbi:hypothetical protein DL240_06435 [Lujinxingia litoralis]|uniref:Acriflavine resistance protein B n=1 Tax=Lujinxingia litoralis TaxID=2211119 RepID=A0A328CC96_9DELT|nr:efflux RND transporter permease subunit [Lujinxingia litoralis]RAL23787.1 hypothetical protein DL240_06435 [Lujinxingia litoralis]